MTTPATPTTPATLCARAAEAGYDDGWTHAAHADAYGGDPRTEPDVPQRFAPVATYYAAAYTDGVTTYLDLDDTDEPEAPVMTAPGTDPGLTLAQFVHGIRDLISDGSHTDLPDPNRFDVEVYGPDSPMFINVIARFRNSAGEDRRQHCLLRVVEISEPEWNHDRGEPLD